jgi:hypothetical protein
VKAPVVVDALVAIVELAGLRLAPGLASVVSAQLIVSAEPVFDTPAPPTVSKVTFPEKLPTLPSGSAVQLVVAPTVPQERTPPLWLVLVTISPSYEPVTVYLLKTVTVVVPSLTVTGYVPPPVNGTVKVSETPPVADVVPPLVIVGVSVPNVTDSAVDAFRPDPVIVTLAPAAPLVELSVIPPFRSAIVSLSENASDEGPVSFTERFIWRRGRKPLAPVAHLTVKGVAEVTDFTYTCPVPVQLEAA